MTATQKYEIFVPSKWRRRNVDSFIMFLCLMEVPNSAKNNTKIFKISTDVNFVTTSIKIKTLVLLSTKDHNFSLIKVNR